MRVKTNHTEEGRRQKAEGGRRNRVSRITHHASRVTLAFTLLELLTVIAIMGILAALVLPSIRGLKPNSKVAATRQLLDAVSRARQLAISQRTTVYMVFVRTNFWTDPVAASWTANDQALAGSLYDKQLVGYAYVCLRSVGDQPGVHTPRYLSSWRTLPAGAYIALGKFWPGVGVTLTNVTVGNRMWPTWSVPAFSMTNNIPFPAETNQPASPAQPYVTLPYIAFDGTGQLVSGQGDQMIPISEGNVAFMRDPNTKVALAQSPQVNEVPAGNTIENYSLIYIDRLTGRARVERRKVQ